MLTCLIKVSILLGMKKNILKKIFGSFTKAADALGVTKGAITFWPEELSQHHIDRIRGACVRLGIYNPEIFETNDAININNQPRPMNEGVNE